MNARLSARPLFLALASVSILLAGCKRETIQVYEVAKEQPIETPATQPHGHGTASAPRATPSESLQWTTPEGWTEKGASGMRAANFGIAADNGEQAEVAVMAFPNMGGSDLQFVNLWRTSLGLDAVDETRLAQMVKATQIGQDNGTIYDVMDPVPEGAPPPESKIVVAKVMRENTSWFFKLAGPTALVEAQTPVFQEFLKTVSFKPGAASPAAPVESLAPPPAPGEGKPQWSVPSSWEEVPPTTMLVAKFRAAGENQAAVDITVSVFPGDVGGLLANVNRWRSQVGQQPVAAEELGKATTSLTIDGSQATLVDVTGTDNESGAPNRLIGVILSRGDQSWFYKMLGHAEVAGREKDAFLEFVKSARYPNG